MSIIRRLLDGSGERRSGNLSDLLALRDGRNVGTHAGVPVNFINAMTHDAVFACVTLLTDTLSTLPIHALRKKGRIRERVPQQPTIVSDPSGVIEPEEFRSQMLLSIFENGNAYAVVIERDAMGFPTQMELRDHQDVRVRREGKAGQPIYRVDGELMLPGEVVHWRGLTRPGSIVGISVFDKARETIARGLAADRYGEQWFAGGAHASGFLKTTRARVNKADADEIKRRFKEATSGRETPVLGMDLDYKEIQSDPQKSQLVEVERLIVEKVARFFHLHPTDVGAASSGQSITYQNREQRAIDFVTFACMPWLVRIEGPWSRLLARGQFVKHNVEGLLRSDTKARYEAHNAAVRGGWRSPDDVREIEDDEPLPDGAGAKYLWPPFSTTAPKEAKDA